MMRTTIFLDEALEYDLKALARRRGQPMALVVREALAEYVVEAKRAGGTSLSFVAAGGSGRDDTAERHEELLWQDAARRGEDKPKPAPAGRQRRSTGRQTGGKQGRR